MSTSRTKEVTKVVGDLPGNLARPAMRALHAAGYNSLQKLSELNEQELLQLHGIGKNAIGKIKTALSSKGLSLK